MFKHHLTLAFRNLRKYKTQNIISITGLAVGFTCFAFSALWIRYEMSYDNFHANADRIYLVNMLNLSLNRWDPAATSAADAIQSRTPFPLGNWLKTNIPQIEDAGAIRSEFPATHFYPEISIYYVDQGFCRIFELPIPESFFMPDRTDLPAAVTDKFNFDADYIKEHHNFDVMATIPSWPANSNFQFDMIVPAMARWPESALSTGANYNTYVLLHDNANIEALKKRLNNIEIPEWQKLPISLVLTPIKQLRYKDQTGDFLADVKFNHIRIYALAGLLVVLCSLFNHISLFVSRGRVSLRELALRKAGGASDMQIATSLTADFLLVVLLSIVVGLMLMVLLLPVFKGYADIRSTNIGIFCELAIYAALLIAVGIFAGSILILYFRKQVLNENPEEAKR